MFSFICSLILGIAYYQGQYVLAQKLEVDLCEKFTSANSSVLPYSFSNNAWGNETGLAVGYQCTKVYDGGALWTTTYKWEGDPTVVKGYPRMKAHPSNMPLQLKSLTQLLVNANYKTFLTEGGESDEAYTSAGLVANVAMDLFVAPTAEQAIQVIPPTEIMVWPWWTPTILPLGYTSSTPDKDTIEVNGVTWSLYHGVNAGGQNVFSWLARSNVSSLNGDYAPLVSYLVDTGYLSGDMWASQLQLGQEMKIALQETNFQVSVSELRLVRDDEGERSEVVQATTPSPEPSLSSSSSSLVVSSGLETTLVTTTTVAPAPSPSTTATDAPPAPPQTTLTSTNAPPPPPDTTTTDPPESSAPAPTTTSEASEAPPPETTTTPVAEPTSTIVTTATLTTPQSSTTSRRTTTMTTATSDAVTTTAAEPTTTTSNAAYSVARGLEDSWFMLLMAFIAGFL